MLQSVSTSVAKALKFRKYFTRFSSESTFAAVAAFLFLAFAAAAAAAGANGADGADGADGAEGGAEEASFRATATMVPSSGTRKWVAWGNTAQSLGRHHTHKKGGAGDSVFFLL